MNSHTTLHSSPVMVSYGVSYMSILEKNNHGDGLIQKRCSTIANTLELRLCCMKQLMLKRTSTAVNYEVINHCSFPPGVCTYSAGHPQGDIACTWGMGGVSGSSHQHNVRRTLQVSRGLEKIADNLNTTFSDAYSWMKMFIFWFQFHWSLFLWIQLIVSHDLWMWNGLGPNRPQAVTWTNVDHILLGHQ